MACQWMRSSHKMVFQLQIIIMQGQVLQIPSAGTTATTTSTTSSTTMATSTVSSFYTVQSGDTLTSIASAYGRTADDLAAINGITGISILDKHYL